MRTALHHSLALATLALGLSAAPIALATPPARHAARSLRARTERPRAAHTEAARTDAVRTARAAAVRNGRTEAARTDAPRTAREARAEAGHDGPVLQVLTRVERSLRSTRYLHVTRVDARAGVFEWDCSGMAAWVLTRAAPHAEQVVLARNGHGRPVAADYYDVIARAPVARGGAWQRVSRIEDARPGDVLAWRRPRWIASRNTGHVAFVVAPTRRVGRAGPGEYYEVRVADATSILHADDTRGVAPRRSGFGYGTLTFRVDPATHQGVAYGWFGRQTEWYVPTPIAIGRPLR